MEYSISINNQLFNLRELSFVTLGFILFIIFVIYLFGLDNPKIYLIIIALVVAYLVLALIPVVLIHNNYLNKTEKKVFIKPDIITINGNLINSNQIQEIKIFATSQRLNKGGGAYSLPYNDYYYYIQIISQDGNIHYLSSLLDYNIDKIVKNNFKDNKITTIPSSFLDLLVK
jgi:hypothetical protein